MINCIYIYIFIGVIIHIYIYIYTVTSKKKPTRQGPTPNHHHHTSTCFSFVYDSLLSTLCSAFALPCYASTRVKDRHVAHLNLYPAIQQQQLAAADDGT
jgi:hypothetical protein